MPFRPTVLPILLLTLAACREPPGPLRVGVVLGEAGVEAAELAMRELQEAGRSGAARVELQIVPYLQTSATAPLEAIAAAEALANDPAVIAVVGHGNSAASIAAAQIYNSHHLPQLAPTTTAPIYGEAGSFSFRLVPDDTHQGRFLARVLLADTARRRVAMVYVNDDYGRALWKAVREALHGTPMQIVAESPVLEAWTPGVLGLTAGAIAEARPQVVLWLARPNQLRLFRPYFTPLAGDGIPFLAGDAADDAMLYDDWRDFVGVRFVRFVDPFSPDPRLQAFRARYRAQTQAEISSDAALSYDGVKLVTGAILSGVRSREEMRIYLEALGRSRPPYPGVAGAVSFDERGDMRRSYLLAEVGPDGTVRPVPGY
jgi:branched-chain amino acid transport system substrate-binding protein